MKYVENLNNLRVRVCVIPVSLLKSDGREWAEQMGVRELVSVESRLKLEAVAFKLNVGTSIAGVAVR